MYKLEGEPQLKYSMFAIMDGNQSLKLVDYMFRSGQQRPDTRTMRSDMWIIPEEVDVFKDEVRTHQRSAQDHKVGIIIVSHVCKATKTL